MYSIKKKNNKKKKRGLGVRNLRAFSLVHLENRCWRRLRKENDSLWRKINMDDLFVDYLKVAKSNYFW